MPSGKASVIVMIEPVTAAIAGFFILDEAMSPNQIIGTLIILGALLINAAKVKVNTHL
jgi:drug/metabolite transporter (DMT)-like permease